MADQGQKTEKPTQQRMRKARQEGQFPAAREFVSAIQFSTALAVLSWCGAAWFTGMREEFRRGLVAAFSADLSPGACMDILRRTGTAAMLPVLAGGGLLIAVTLGAQLAATNMGVSFKKLSPSFARMNPAANFKNLVRNNLPQMLQAAILLSVVAYSVYTIATEHFQAFLLFPLMSLTAGMFQTVEAVFSMLWRLAAILLVFGFVELMRQRWIYHRDLGMTKQEVKDEHKESEGDPNVKGQIRRLRRDLLRRRMISEVPQATAIVVNPTHFAVAIRYDMQTMSSPKVVAKGRNYLALRIRQIGVEHGVTIIENPPLARALYKAVDVGQEIPPEFYRAVAEVLAYVYKVLNHERR